MLLYPNAKLNLGLDIVEKRPDGFHNIETLFIPCELRDILEIVPSDSLEMYQYGLPYDGEAMDNLCVKAWKALNEKYSIPPVAIYLYKKIPVGAGLGGGSSDASHTLLALNELFSLGLTQEELADIAATLGSDCPFFIYNTPMLASGRGEILTPFDIDLSRWRIEIITPEIFVSTREAYAGVTPKRAEIPLEEILRRPVEEWRNLLKNDFEESVFAAHPQLAEEKRALYERGAVYASMSGSGSSLFGLFSRPLSGRS